MEHHYIPDDFGTDEYNPDLDEFMEDMDRIARAAAIMQQAGAKARTLLQGLNYVDVELKMRIDSIWEEIYNAGSGPCDEHWLLDVYDALFEDYGGVL